MNRYNYHFLSQLIQLPFIEEIWMYGSRARGDYAERSDIDLAIICPQATLQEWQQVVDIIEGADTLIKIDYVRFDQLPEDKFKHNIIKFKKLIYKKETRYMDKELWRDYFENLGNALDRLNEALIHKEIDIVDLLRDAAIQRFEFTIELYWKVLKRFLAYEKIVSITPREVLQNAFQYGFIDDDKVWLAMLDDRNRTSHIYKQEEAAIIFQHIKTYYPIMEATYRRLQKKFDAY